MAQQPLVGQGLLIIEASRWHSDTPYTVGLLWTIDQPDAETVPDNTQHSQETDIHAFGGIRTHNPSKRAAADPCLRPRGDWDKTERYSFGYTEKMERKVFTRPIFSVLKMLIG
jgi:hypothetical protein